jgi:glycosyltransferase involved in cell wall biosynthesis
MKKTTNIVIVSLYGIGNKGGVERVCFYLNKILSKEYTVNILTRTKLSFGKLDAIIQPILIILKLLFMRRKIVISNSWQSFFYPVDFSIHHGTFIGYIMNVPELDPLAVRIKGFMEKISGRQAKRIVAVSEHVKNELISLYRIKAEKIMVINNFVDESMFFPDLSIKHDKIIILFSGRLETGKGLVVLKLLSDYLETIDNYSLFIACNNDLNVSLFSNNKKTKLFIGLQADQMCSFYNSGDILFFPTRYEGFSMVTLEALSCGIPVIGTNYAIQDGLCQYNFTEIFDSSDIKELLKHIDILVSNYKGRKDEIHESIKQDFGYKQYETKLLSLINN